MTWKRQKQKFNTLCLWGVAYGLGDEGIDWSAILQLPKPAASPTATVCQLNSQTLDQFIQQNANTGVVVIRRDASTSGQSADNFGQQSAQLLANKNIAVCELSVDGQTVGGQGSEVVVYMNGKLHPYYGRRSASALLSFVLKLTTTHVRLITGKLDKKAYDLVNGPKLVGFFMPSTPDLIAYETVAAKYSPDVPFYLVTDRMVAKHLKLTVVGQINLVKPAEKLAITLPINPATGADIEAFIQQNKGVVLKYLTEHNVYDPSLQDPNRTSIVAIGDRTAAVGQYFHKLLTKAVRNITRENAAISAALLAKSAAELADPALDSTGTATADTAADTVAAETPIPSPIDLDSLEILWIDPQVFPSISVWLDQIPTTGAQRLDIYIGAVNPAAAERVWLDTTALNTTGGKGADETNLLLVRQWLQEVIATQVAAAQALASNVATIATITEPTTQTGRRFSAEPQSLAVREGQPFVLECVVTGDRVSAAAGDCLWLKDGRNIGANLARVSPDYQWRQQTTAGAVNVGDCSLVVASADAQRDNGQWVCEVAGDQRQPTLASRAATVTVTPAPKTEL
ncbi:unnamed protein product [Medioppia subpectinata]|uniref:Calsequestrin n=1 Tax=Medioppia subpectinata TaxID=1979941 RepID=A0A7R9KXH5_9ACAR|nr:unnamed protein product [Medioppia subpectinata]CAG2111686.1 unnamed protein product [Medioppia subpectinata]